MVLLRGVRGVCWLIRSVSLSAPLLARQAGVLARRHGRPRLTRLLGRTVATSRYALDANRHSVLLARMQTVRGWAGPRTGAKPLVGQFQGAKGQG